MNKLVKSASYTNIVREVGAVNFPFNLNLYRPLDNKNIQVEYPVLNDIIFERLEALNIIKKVSQEGFIKYSEEWQSEIKRQWRENDVQTYSQLIENVYATPENTEARQNDYVSHYLLIVAFYSRGKDVKHWLFLREMELFTLRLLQLKTLHIKSILKLLNIDYPVVSKDDKFQHMDQLYRSTVNLSSIVQVLTTEFYKVPWVKVKWLMKSRQLFIKNGFAFVPSLALFQILIDWFETSLRHRILTVESIASKTVDTVLHDEDWLLEMFVEMIDNFNEIKFPKKYLINVDDSETSNEVSIDSLDELSYKSYPLCMRHLHETLLANNHLKYFGRRQYGLFLKGIGVTVESSLKFWKNIFCEKMDSKSFSKKYAYQIRYNYGLEGSRIDQPPFSCEEIINEHVGPGDMHGCPFKHFDEKSLRERLHSYGVMTEEINDIIQLVRSGDYQGACGKYFEVTQKSISIEVDHPNKYFEESRKIAEFDEAVEQNKVENLIQFRDFNFQMQRLDIEDLF